MSKYYHWYAGSGRPLHLKLDRETVTCCSHAGPCDADIEAAIRNVDGLAEQLQAMDPAELAAELAEYGAWEEEELQDFDVNCERILWIACGDIREERGI